MVLPLAGNVKPGTAAQFRMYNSRAKVTAASRDGRLGSVIHSSAPPTRPNRGTGLYPRVHIRRGGLLRHDAFYIGNEPMARPFCYKSRYEYTLTKILLILRKVMSHAETPLAQVSSCSIRPFKRYIAEKQVPAMLKPIVEDG